MPMQFGPMLPPAQQPHHSCSQHQDNLQPVGQAQVSYLSTNQLLNPGARMPSSAYAPGQQSPSASASLHLERAKAAGKRRKHDGEKEEEEQKESPKVKMTPRWFFLERTVYSADDDDIIWIAAETSEGLSFRVSLCTQEPPSISRLL